MIASINQYKLYNKLTLQAIKYNYQLGIIKQFLVLYQKHVYC